MTNAADDYEATLPIDIPMSPLPTAKVVIDLCSSSPAGQGPSTPLSLSLSGSPPRAPKRSGQHRVVGPAAKRRLFSDEDLGDFDSDASDSEADGFVPTKSDEDFVISDSEASVSDCSVSSDDETSDEKWAIRQGHFAQSSFSDAASFSRRLSFCADVQNVAVSIEREIEKRPDWCVPTVVNSFADLFSSFRGNGGCSHDYSRICDSCLGQLAGVVDAALFLRCRRFSMLPVKEESDSE